VDVDVELGPASGGWLPPPEAAAITTIKATTAIVHRTALTRDVERPRI
jgi:hypothetical protein